MRRTSLVKSVLIGVLTVALVAAAIGYFWPMPTIQQACMGGNQWCREEGTNYTVLASRADWSEDEKAIEFYVNASPGDLWWRTKDSMLRKGLGPHAWIAAAYILSEPAVDEGFLTYQVFGWNVSMLVVNPVPGSQYRDAGSYGFFHLVFWRWNR